MPRPRHKDDLDESLANRIQIAVDSFDQEVRSASQKREDTRSIVTIILMIVYGIAIISLIVIGGILLIVRCKEADLTGVLSLGDMLQKLILPVITLVLGFYYGTQEKN